MRNVLALASAGLLAIVTSGCVSNQVAPGVTVSNGVNPFPVGPGGARVTTHSPDPEKWNMRRVGATQYFFCKPLACQHPASAAVTISRSPTPKPDPVALERYAKQAVPADVRAKDAMMASFSGGDQHAESLSSEHTKIRGYEAVRWDVRRSNGSATSYFANAFMFVGGLLVKIEARSDSRAEARDILNTIVEVTDFEYQPLS